MNPELKDEIINYHLQHIGDNDFDISQVRSDLEKRNIEPEEMNNILRIVENEFRHYSNFKRNKAKGIGMMWLGLVLIVIGVTVTFLTYKGIVEPGNQKILSYGPFLGGLSLVFIGLSKRYRRLE